MTKSIIDFLKAKNKAFEEKGTEFGEFEFICPTCSGKAWAIHTNTPNNIAHSTTVRAGCESCGISMMN